MSKEIKAQTSENARELQDTAAREIYAEVEELECEHGVPYIAVAGCWMCDE